MNNSQKDIEERFDKLGKELTLYDDRCGDLNYCELSYWSVIKDFFITEIGLAEKRGNENALKGLIKEYVNNELDGKGYDFYFAIRTKLYDIQK